MRTFNNRARGKTLSGFTWPMITLEVQTLGEYLAFQESLIPFPEVQHVFEDQSFRAESHFLFFSLKGRGGIWKQSAEEH
jgi:uncharacterized protein (AIM24 family)